MLQVLIQILAIHQLFSIDQTIALASKQPLLALQNREPFSDIEKLPNAIRNVYKIVVLDTERICERDL